MSDLSDNSDRASLREEQLRDDAVADMRRKLADQAAKTAAEGAAHECDTCGFNIPEARRHALPDARLCVGCARDAETRAKVRKRV